jgi:hypothetical protein
LRADVRARSPLPGLELQLPDRPRDRRGVLVEELGAGVRGAGVVEPRNGAIETSIDRPGGDYHSFELKKGDGDEACKAACTADNKCRAWTFARAGYVGKEPHCFLKKEIKPPRHKAGYTSGVVR